MHETFKREVRKLRPDLEFVGAYSYRPPVQHVLCGFCLNPTRWGEAYIERYAFALYDPVERPNLNLAERLPVPEVFVGNGNPPSQQAVEFVERIGSYEESTFAWDDLEVFFSVIEALPERVRLLNGWVRRTRCLTLVMLGRTQEAEEELAGILAMPGHPQSPEFLRDLKTLSAALSRGLADAQAQLLTWEREAKIRHGIELPSSQITSEPI